MAVKILDELCDCHPTVSEHLLQLGLEREDAKELATIIKNEIEASKPVEGKGMKYINYVTVHRISFSVNLRGSYFQNLSPRRSSFIKSS